MNSSVNEKYMKFIIEILYENKCYYTLWGDDEKLKNTFLLNDANDVFLFENPKTLIAFIKDNNQKYGFDTANLVKWVNEIDDSYEVTSFNFDAVMQWFTNPVFVVDNKYFDFLRNVMNCLSLVDDYLEIVNYEDLELCFDKISYSELHEVLMNILIWKVSEKEKESSLKDIKKRIKEPGMSANMKEVFDLFLQVNSHR